MSVRSLRPGGAASALILVCLSVAPVAVAAPAPAAPTQSSDQIYCIVQDLTNNRVFHSEVFRGDYGRSMDYKLAFQAHVAARWGPLGSGPGALCWFEADRSQASDAQNRLATEHQTRRYEVVWTRWSG